VADPPDHFDQSPGHVAGATRARPWHVDLDGRLRHKMTRQPLRIKRVYKPPDTADGIRILVDRLWPRGLSRERAQIDLWLREIAPSDALRRRFHGNPAGWEDFKTAYYAELEQPAA